jgi:PIN domain nuclease of toxin-antitoxin system
VRVYDASALLALLNGEPGGDRVLQFLGEGPSAVASVNYTEVLSKLLDRGLAEAAADEAWRSLEIAVHAVDASLARHAAQLRGTTRSFGLSLADRCCLALAARLDGATIVTADRAWKSLKGFRFTIIR